MKFDIDGSELDVLMMSLIGRRNNIRDLLNIPGNSADYISQYSGELAIVERLMEKMMPGCLEHLKPVVAA